MNSVVVLIGGGHAAGKRTTAKWIKADLLKVVPLLEVEVIDMDDYCDQKSLSVGQEHGKNAAITVIANRNGSDLRPSRFDFEALQQHIEKVAATLSATKKVIIVHGLYALYEKSIRDLSHIKVFISGDSDTRLIRWIRRDALGDHKTTELETIINAYLHGAKQEMSDFIFPTKEQADVIMPRGAESNAVALIVDGILPYLDTGSNEKMPEPSSSNALRPSDQTFKHEKFDAQKRKYYDVA